MKGGKLSALTVTAKGQSTLRKEVLRHLGVKPGDKLELELLPEGTAGCELPTARRKRSQD